MSINGINSYATSFKGNNNTVKIGNKEVKKSTLAAAGVATAATAATIALGVVGKKTAQIPEGTNMLKKVGLYVKEGAKVFGEKITGLFFLILISSSESVKYDANSFESIFAI